MNTNTSELKDVEKRQKAAYDAVETLKIINKTYNKQKQQVEEMYALFSELLNILSKVDAKSDSEAQNLAWSIRTALMTYMLRIKSIGENE